jgi:hypothetical protein
MIVYLDTEFSDFFDSELLSLGLVTGDGRELYIERADAAEINTSDFVKAEVLPLFGRESPVVLPYEEIGDRVIAWFDELRGGDRSVAIEVISDSELDHRLLIDLLPSPAWFRSVNVIDKLVQNLLSGRQWDRYVKEAEAWHLRVGVEHHALVDARIMARAFEAAKDWDRE